MNNTYVVLHVMYTHLYTCVRSVPGILEEDQGCAFYKYFFFINIIISIIITINIISNTNNITKHIKVTPTVIEIEAVHSATLVAWWGLWGPHKSTPPPQIRFKSI